LASKKVLKGHFGGEKRTFKRKVWAKGKKWVKEISSYGGATLLKKEAYHDF